MTDTYQDFLDQLAEKESSYLTRPNPEGSYLEVNQLGYLGKYQMGELALIDAGYYKKGDGTTANDFTGQWTGKDGIFSKTDFLNTPEAQENAIQSFHDRNWGYIKFYKLEQYIGQEIGGVEITASGAVAGAHLVGIGALREFLNSGGAIIPEDGNNVPITTYIDDLGGYNMPYIPNTMPPVAPSNPTNYFNIFNDVDTVEEQFEQALSEGFEDGYAVHGGNYYVYLDPNVLNADGQSNVFQAGLLTNWWRPGAGELSDFNFSLSVTTAFGYYGSGIYGHFFNEGQAEYNAFFAESLSRLNALQARADSYLNIDPLVLDLDGDGAELQNFAANDNILEAKQSLLGICMAA